MMEKSIYTKRRLAKISSLLRSRMFEKNIRLDDLLRRSRKIREEIADEWF